MVYGNASMFNHAIMPIEILANNNNILACLPKSMALQFPLAMHVQTFCNDGLLLSISYQSNNAVTNTPASKLMYCR